MNYELSIGVPMKTSITSESLRHHLRYNWWKYLLIAMIGFGLVDLLYSVTAYRSPRNKTLGLYVCGYVNEAPFSVYLDHIRETEMPDMEVLSSQALFQDDSYGAMQLTTYLAVGEGDLYLLPREQFLSFAESGALIPLEEDTELTAVFDDAGVSLQSGWRRETETGETHLYGIPLDKLPGLSQYVYVEDGYLTLIVTGGNPENAQKLLHILCRDMITPPPEEQ